MQIWGQKKISYRFWYSKSLPKQISGNLNHCNTCSKHKYTASIIGMQHFLKILNLHLPMWAWMSLSILIFLGITVKLNSYLLSIDRKLSKENIYLGIIYANSFVQSNYLIGRNCSDSISFKNQGWQFLTGSSAAKSWRSHSYSQQEFNFKNTNLIKGI